MLSLLLLTSTLSPEGGDAAHAGTWLGVPLIVWQVANLSLFLFLLVYFLKKPLAKVFADRRSEIAAALAKAEADRVKAEELTKAMATRLSQIETELEALRTKARKDTEAEQRELTRQTEEDAARIASKATAELESRVRAARKELTAFASDLAVEMATRIVKEKVTTEDHRRLITEGLQSLGRLAAAPPPKAS